MNDHLTHDVVFGQATGGENCLADGIRIRHFMEAAYHFAAAVAEDPEPAPAPEPGVPEVLVLEQRVAHPDDQAVGAVLESCFWEAMAAGCAVPVWGNDLRA